jgi:hypothetical protein
MPAFLTYWHMLIETAQQSQDAGSNLGSLIVDAAALRRRAHGWSTPPQTSATGAIWDTGPLPAIDFRFPGSDLSALAYLGALAPDIMYYHPRYRRNALRDDYTQSSAPLANLTRAPFQWSELFHRSHTSDMLMAFLEQVALVPSPALRSQALAFLLGYVSHIATDLALNPWMTALAARLPATRLPGPRALIALRLDEYLAEIYFQHPRYSLFSQPWAGYIDPVARDFSQPGSLLAQLLQLLTNALEVYDLEEAQVQQFPQDFREGLAGLRSFLAGHGWSRRLTLGAVRRTEQHDLVSRVLSDPGNEEIGISLEQVLGYSERLGIHLCRQAINYYTALRNPHAGASERSARRTDLLKDLQNWNLHTGSTIASSDTDALQLHNWKHFASLWGETSEQQEQRLQEMLALTYQRALLTR